MAGAILISTFGCVNGLVLAGARVYYAMARDGLFFRGVATTNRFHVPGGRAGRPGPLGGPAGAAGDGRQPTDRTASSSTAISTTSSWNT